MARIVFFWSLIGRPAAAAKKAARCLSRSMGGPRRGECSGAGPVASARAAPGDDLAPALGRHAGTEAVTALAHQIARLKGPLHDLFSAGAGYCLPARR